MKKLLTGIFLVCMAFTMNAQQDPHFTMYRFNRQMINPAFVGSRGALAFNASFRHQWTGFAGNPNTIGFGAHSTLNRSSKESKVAVGLMAFNDKLGVSDHIGVYGQYAYRILFRDYGLLSIGLQGGFTHLRMNLTDLDPINVDPAFGDNITGKFLPNVGIGAQFMSDKFYVGLSVPHLIQNEYSESFGTNSVARQYRHFFLMGAGVFDLTDDIQFVPSIQMKYVRTKTVEAPLGADFGVNFVFNRTVLVGIGFRPVESVSGILQVKVARGLRMGYSYDLGIGNNNLSKYHGGSHEFFVGYDLNELLKIFTYQRSIIYL